MQLDHINICTLQNPTIAISNTQDTGVSVSKKDVIASAETCDDEMQYHANVQLLEKLKEMGSCREHSHDLDQQLSQETETLLLATMLEDDKEMPPKLSLQDIRHFNTNLEERRNYIIKTLKLDENELIDTKQKLDEVTQLFLDHWGILDINGDRLAKFKCQEKLEIITHGQPIAAKTRFVNPVLAEKVKKKLQEWIKSGIIIPSTTPWQSPLVMVPKKTSPFIRISVDYSPINSVTQPLRFPLPHIQDCISRLSNKSIVSNMDIKEAFHSSELHPNSIDKTSITTQWGNYAFTQASFGLTNIPAFWSMMIGKVFQPLNAANYLIHFLDDGLVFSDDFNTHLVQLRNVLDVLMKNGLILQLSKCHIIKEEIDFLGFTINKEGIQPITQSVEIIKNIPYPCNIKELRAIFM